MWRVIRASQNDAFMNMAIDEAICNSVRDGDSPPTIRFYTWRPSAVSIGYFQSLVKEVDVDYCNAHGIHIVRRRTGGGAVYHDSEGELTYSVIAPEHMFPKGIVESYKVICGWIIDGLARIGMHSSFKPINDIVLNGKKISGNAQTRRDGILLQHGTILYGLDLDTMFKCLKVSDEKIRDKLITSARQRVACISDYAQVSMNEVRAALLRGFCDGKNWKYGDLSKREIADATFLSNSKYSAHHWNFWR